MPLFDPFRRSYLDNPYPSLAKLRREDPVHRSRELEGWVVTRHADAREVLRDNERFSNDPTTSTSGLGVHVAASRRRSPLGETPLLGSSDPPVHTRLRGIVARQFTPRVVEESRPRARALIEELLDGGRVGDEIEFMSAVAQQLPVLIIGELLGLEPDERGPLREWTRAVMRVIGGGELPPSAYREAEAAAAQLRAFLDEYRERHEGPPTVLSALVAAEREDERLSTEETVSLLTFLYMAGGGPTALMLGNALLTLLSHRDQWELLREQPELARSAIVETLRWDSATHLLLRFATKELALGRRTIGRGDTVFVNVCAAHRDPEVFEDPDRFDIRRQTETGSILAFGIGPHFCLGQPLALIQGEELLLALVERFPTASIARNGVDRLQELLLRGPARLCLDVA
jgi:hypothetical protein